MQELLRCQICNESGRDKVYCTNTRDPHPWISMYNHCKSVHNAGRRKFYLKEAQEQEKGSQRRNIRMYYKRTRYHPVSAYRRLY